MLAHEPDNLPVGGLQSARAVTTAVIVLCLLLMVPGVRGRSWPPVSPASLVFPSAQPHRAIVQRFVVTSGVKKNAGGGVGYASQVGK